MNDYRNYQMNLRVNLHGEQDRILNFNLNDYDHIENVVWVSFYLLVLNKTFCYFLTQIFISVLFGNNW